MLAKLLPFNFKPSNLPVELQRSSTETAQYIVVQSIHDASTALQVRRFLLKTAQKHRQLNDHPAS